MATTESTPLTLPRLEAHLWRAADLFRNKVSNQKDYILALLFFKRASDLYREETDTALEQLGDVSNADELARDLAFHILQVPAGHTWDDVRDTDEALQGQALNDALAAIGRANPKQLAGVFERTDFNNKMALPSDDLARIIEHFNKLGPLNSAHVATDMLGRAYEWLIAKFAAASGKGGGEFYTPAEVGELMAALLEPEEGDRIYDPTCGSGGLLLQCLARAEAQGVSPRSLFVYGQELNPETWAIARMNMLLHGAGDAADIKLGDTLATPAFVEREKLRTFDIVVANPPFSSKNWGHERFKASGDPFGRIKHLPPKSHGEMAFLQHMVASMNEKGRLAVVLPNGVFFRGGAELAVRRELLDADLIEAIVQLPVDLFYGAGIPACVAVINRRKHESRHGRILMIDGSNGFERRDTKNVLSEEGMALVANAFRSGDEQPGFSRWVGRDEIASQKHQLVVRTYVGGEGKYKGAARQQRNALSYPDAVSAYENAHAVRARAEADIAGLIERVGAIATRRADSRHVRLAEIATLDTTKVRVEADDEYAIVGVLNAGQGLFWRETISGSATTYATLQRLKTGQLVYRKLTAWEGPITVVPAEFDGGYVSSEFPTYTLDDKVVLPDFMALVCQRPALWNEMRKRSKGTAERRGRLNPQDLLAVEIELPDLESQSEFVALARLARAIGVEAHSLLAINGAALEQLLVGDAEEG
jgi:type I restriction enzyme M protein